MFIFVCITSLQLSTHFEFTSLMRQSGNSYRKIFTGDLRQIGSNMA